MVGVVTQPFPVCDCQTDRSNFQHRLGPARYERTAYCVLKISLLAAVRRRVPGFFSGVLRSSLSLSFFISFAPSFLSLFLSFVPSLRRALSLAIPDSPCRPRSTSVSSRSISSGVILALPCPFPAFRPSFVLSLPQSFPGWLRRWQEQARFCQSCSDVEARHGGVYGRVLQ